ncbi:alpha-N-acetylneuraminide alpha-2,8-sialyltransferase-like [Clupea harengus]|uniref:Alpha-N-acetylneuraminide alpha-2,8-sialyltransferase n=1 Tax=Clupea harengus TaxID=7950 RepID=A0A6P8FQV3_CLUHA|nr:alpha-N-acetylneuraminide alpha-2,8-sialyltransferase-like [Clupea harengus]
MGLERVVPAYSVSGLEVSGINDNLFYKLPETFTQKKMLEPPLPPRLSSCAVVGNGGILKNSGCGQEIDRAQLIIRCNLPPLTTDSGKRTHIVTVNPSILDKRFKDRKGAKLLESLSVYNRSFIYMPAFSSRTGMKPSFWAAQTVADASSNQTVLFAHPEFLRRVSAFWAARGVRAGRLSSGLFMLTLALSLCDQVYVYGFWPFPRGPDNKTVSHHYYDNILPNRMHAMPQEFKLLTQLRDSGVIRLQLGNCVGVEHEPGH